MNEGPATENQRAMLQKIMPPDQWERIATMTKHEAHVIISAYKAANPDKWNESRKPTSSQVYKLRQHKLWHPNLNRGEAAHLIERFDATQSLIREAELNWKRR